MRIPRNFSAHCSHEPDQVYGRPALSGTSFSIPTGCLSGHSILLPIVQKLCYKGLDSPSMPESERISEKTPRVFATTHWSVVLAAGDQTSPETEKALSRLCQNYWFPIYAFV